MMIVLSQNKSHLHILVLFSQKKHDATFM